MKKLVFKGLLFIFPFVVAVLIWEYELGKVVNSYSKKRQHLESELSSIQVLVLGNSHELYGVNPAYFSIKGYNVADVSQSLFYDKSITMKYLPQMKSLKFVFIDISYFSLWFQLKNDPVEDWRDYFYAQFWNIRFPELKWYNINLYSKIAIYSPHEAIQYALKQFNVNLAENISDNGWESAEWLSKLKVQSDTLTNARVKRLDGFCKTECLNDNLQYLDTLLTQLNRHNIKAIFLTLPVTANFIHFADKRKLFLIDSVMGAEQLRNHCSYHNYIQDQRFNASDFADPDHLNPTGAEKFSKILNREILGDTTDIKHD